MFDETIASAAAINNIPQEWIKAVIQVESNWNPDAVNMGDPGGGAWGLMQILLSTARGLGYIGSGAGLLDPGVNIQYGARLLGQLKTQYGTDFRRIYSAYNSGNPDRWQTSQEVYNNVMRAMEALGSFLAQNPGISAGALAIVVLLVILFAKRGF